MTYAPSENTPRILTPEQRKTLEWVLYDLILGWKK